MLKLISLSNNYRFVACLLWLAATPLLAEEIKCPDHVSIVKQAIVSPVEGWHLSSRFDSLLNDGGIVSSGTPEERADLKGEDSVINGVKMTRWDFDEEDHQWGIWFSCSYGQGNILLSRQVKGPVTMCWSRDSVPAKLICQ